MTISSVSARNEIARKLDTRVPAMADTKNKLGLAEIFTGKRAELANGFISAPFAAFASKLIGVGLAAAIAAAATVSGPERKEGPVRTAKANTISYTPKA